MRYVDGFLLPVPTRLLKTYVALARRAGKVWMDHGALAYCEGAGDDLKHKGMVLTFPKSVKLKRGETVFFSWIVYRSRAHRDRVNAKVMTDSRMTKMMEEASPVFDMKRMAYGGFRALVDL